MSAIYTKAGDAGDTGLLGGSRTGKDNLRVWCYGTVDEANSALGLAYACLLNRKKDSFDELKTAVREIQQKMFVVGAELACDEQGVGRLKERVTEADVLWLEKIIDNFTRIAGEIRSFVIPGQSLCSSHLHLARSITRRAERLVVQLSREDHVAPVLIQYLNRLSDALFTMARAEVRLSFVEHLTGKVMQEIADRAGTQESGEETDCAVPYGFCLKMAEAVRAESWRIRVPVTFCVADAEGNPLYLHRMPDAILPSIDIAINKAYSAAVMRSDTAALGKLAQPGASLYGLNITNPRLISFGGGFPLMENGKVVGAIGISGGSVEEDCMIAQKALEYWNRKEQA